MHSVRPFGICIHDSSQIMWLYPHSTRFPCPFRIRCSFENNGEHMICAMCEQIHYERLHSITWRRIIQLKQRSHKSLDIAPQYVQCCKCNKERVIQIPFSSLQTWCQPLDWHCSLESTLTKGCDSPTDIPTPTPHSESSYEALILKIQRHLRTMKRIRSTQPKQAEQKMNAMNQTITQFEIEIGGASAPCDDSKESKLSNHSNPISISSSTMCRDSALLNESIHIIGRAAVWWFPLQRSTLFFVFAI